MSADTPEHPLYPRGRRQARDVITTAEAIGRRAGDEARASALSMALQLILSAALVDGDAPHDAYEALIFAVAWAVCRLPRDDRPGVLAAIVGEIASRVRDFPDLPSPAELN